MEQLLVGHLSEKILLTQKLFHFPQLLTLISVLLFLMLCWPRSLFASTCNLDHDKEGHQIFPSIELAQMPYPCGVFEKNDGIKIYNHRFSQLIEANQISIRTIEFMISEFFSNPSENHEDSKEIFRINGEDFSILLIQQQGSQDEYTFFIEEDAQQEKKESTALMFFYIDNYDEVYKSTPTEDRSFLIAEIDNTVYQWCLESQIFIKKYSENRYLGLVNDCSLSVCKDNKFDILDKVNAVRKGNKIAATLSLGISVGGKTAQLMGQNAEAALDMAVSRGGDQVVVKEDGKVKYFGAKRNLTRSRSRVKARMIARQIQQIIDLSDHVVVVGHKAPDLDSFGAAVAASVLAKRRKKVARIVIDQDDPWIQRLSNHLIPEDVIKALFAEPKEVGNEMTEKTLLIIVDTNRPHLVLEPDLLEKAGNVVVIDHHRRVDQTIDQAEIMYIDPYASSTTEMLVEFFQYTDTPVILDEWEATIMLAGIALDTKNFTVHTGAGTFEAAAYLRKEGADPLLVRDMMRDDLATFILRADIMHNIEIYKGIFAIGVYDEMIENASELAAQTADQMLNIRGVEASFVLCKYSGGIWISARSLGQVNVQNMLEKLGGGGHMMGAGAQLSEMSMDEAKNKTIQIIDDHMSRREEK